MPHVRATPHAAASCTLRQASRFSGNGRLGHSVKWVRMVDAVSSAPHPQPQGMVMPVGRPPHPGWPFFAPRLVGCFICGSPGIFASRFDVAVSPRTTQDRRQSLVRAGVDSLRSAGMSSDRRLTALRFSTTDTRADKGSRRSSCRPRRAMIDATARALAIVAACGSAARVALVFWHYVCNQLSVFHRALAGRAKSHLDIAAVNRGFAAARSHHPDSGRNHLAFGVHPIGVSRPAVYVFYAAASFATLTGVDHCFRFRFD